MVGLVENQKRACRHLASSGPQIRCVLLVDQQVVRHDEGAAGSPDIDAEAVLATHRGDELAIDDLEGETELRAQLVLPLQGHRRRRGNQGEVDASAQQQLAQDQAGLDRFAEADIVGDQQIDPRQLERLAERKELIGVEPDTGAKGRLQQLAVGGAGCLPADGAEPGLEHRDIVGAVAVEDRPRIVVELVRRNLGLPDDIEPLALRVVIDTGQGQARLAPFRRYRLYEPSPAAHRHEISNRKSRRRHPSPQENDVVRRR